MANDDDLDDVAASYEERTEAEIEALEEEWRPASRKVANYVAKPAPGWNVHGLWHCFGTHHRTGYAAHAVSLHWMLREELGIVTELVPHRMIDIDIERFPDDRAEMLMRWHQHEKAGHSHLLFCSYPPDTAAEMADAGFPPLVPYCAFEGTRLHPYIRDLCNNEEAFRKVWVVSDFVQRSLVASGVDPSRVHVVRPMLVGGPWKFRPVADYVVDSAESGAEFQFGVVGTWHARKGMLDLVRAYFSAFERSEDVRLVIRTSAFGEELSIRQFEERLTEQIAEIAAEFGDSDFPHSKAQPKLRLELGTALSDQELIDWLASIDTYVNPSYGEGLGIPLIWAKAAGVPVVSSGYGAVGDLLDEISARTSSDADVQFPFELVPVPPEMMKTGVSYGPDTEWGGYDIHDLATAMRESFERGSRVDSLGAYYVREAFGPDAQGTVGAVKDGLVELLDREWAEKWRLL